MRILGVELGREVMKVSVVDRNFISSKQVRAEQFPVPGGEARSGAVREILAKLKHDLGQAQVVVGLPLINFSHQVIDMPEMKKSDMKNALAFELEKYLPLPVDEYFFDFITFPAGKGRTTAIVFSIRKDIVLDVTGCVRDAGLEPVAVRLTAVEAFHGLMDVAGEKQLSGLSVSSDESSYEITGLRNSRPVFFKVIPKSADLLTEIERLRVSYPGRVYFTGNADPPSGAGFEVRRFQVLAPRLLALSASGKNDLAMDFLPREMLPPEKDFTPYVMGGLAVLTVLLFLLTGVVRYYREWTTLKQIETRRASLRDKAAGLLESRKKLDLLMGDRKVLADYLGRSSSVIRVMDVLSEAIPGNAWLIHISIDEKGVVEIEGFTAKTAAVISAIEKTGEFRNVSFTAPIIAKDGEERFALKMEVGP